ncbi:hypothetical protein BC936DRAFT_146406 [Jimgerdemannia flammicorona]|uniref:RRM domain-containing protein n=1 Tax=Jimgerdemannia flammicorona TaxID=994334 RepID=A0A433D7U0_9FUNG|nr:hypothetical protein BC936DRAFT_146406 [Jimgerdemannia flammicorona]
MFVKEDFIIACLMVYSIQLFNTSAMSRLIVKNLPKYLTDERLREHFASQGDVTDAKLMKTSQGVSRRFAYIGYRTEKEAKAALKFFNDTYIDTSKIIVEKAKPIGDTSLPRPWSVYSVGSSTYLRSHGIDSSQIEAERAAIKAKRESEFKAEIERKQRHLRALYKGEEDPKLREYLEVMQPRSKSKTWANDDVAMLKAQQDGANREERARRQAKGKKGAAMPKVATVAVANKKAGGEGQLLTKVHVTFDDSDDDLYDDLPGKKGGEEEGGEENEDTDKDEEAKNGDYIARDKSISDLEYLKSKMTLKDDEDVDMEQNDSNDEDGALDDEDEEDDTNLEGKSDFKKGAETAVTTDAVLLKLEAAQPIRPPVEPEVPPAEVIADTGRLFVRNLPYTCTEAELRKLFQKFGPLSEVHMPIVKDTKQPKGYAYILYLIPEHAVKAYASLDSKFFQGRLLHILPAKEKPQLKEDESSAGFNGAKMSSVKRQKDQKKKAQSGSDFNWNSLYMSGDAIAASIADRLGVSKSDLLNPESDNIAVRLALAETQLVAETKTFLEEQGISVDSFGKKERSDTVILVKNIPYGTTEGELSALFGKHGDLGRILIPPAKTMAIIEFLEPSEARSAFTHLAYRRFKDTLIYLEKAPVGVFKSKYDPALRSAAASTSKPDTDGKKPQRSMDVIGAQNETADDAADAEVATLFVKNLNFSTTDEGLRKAFAAIQGFRSAQIKWKNDPKAPAKKLSMGFGFVEFANKEDATKAMKAMQNFSLDGHALQIKFSGRGAANGAHGSESKVMQALKANTTKLVVRNVPFEATKKDLKELFGSYGQLKSLRLPKKFAGGHRGFAFLDFMTKQEARNVYDNMANIHLYGRHLVLEWAEEDGGVESLREKTSKQFAREEIVSGRVAKRRRVDLDGEDDAFGEAEDDMSD